MIRVHLIEAPPGAEPAEAVAVPAAETDWKTLDELARTALRLARRLREQQDAEDWAAAEAGGDPVAEHVAEPGTDVMVSAVTTADLAEPDQGRYGAAFEMPAARRDRPDG